MALYSKEGTSEDWALSSIKTKYLGKTKQNKKNHIFLVLCLIEEL